MIKLSAISPRTNAFMQSGGDGNPEELAFEKIFSNMAYSMLEAKAPKLLDGIITFKVLDSDIDGGKATGVFIGQRGGAVIYIPMVLVDSTVKTPEMFYNKEVDAFMPLTEGWLDEVEKIDSSDMGNSAEAPEFIDHNPDIRGITSPPGTGRFSYASADLKIASVDINKILNSAGNRTKTAFATLLKNNEACLKAAVKYHGDRIIKSLQPAQEKVASNEKSWWVLTPEDSPESFRDAFGRSAPLAYKTATLTGVAVRDLRKTASVAVSEEVSVKKHVNPTDSGVYKIVDTTGKVSVVAILKNPADISGDNYGQDKFLVIFPTGKYARVSSVVAIDTDEALPEGPLKKALQGEGRSLRRGKQVLIKGGGSISGTFPVNISVLSEGKDGSYRGSIVGDNMAVVQSKQSPLKVPHTPKDSRTCFVPHDYVSVPLKEEVNPDSIVGDAATAEQFIANGIAKVATLKVTIKDIGAGEWAVDGVRSGDTRSTISKLAELGVRTDSALEFISGVGTGQKKTALCVSPGDFNKLSSVFNKTAQPGMDPSMMDPSMMDPAMMGQPGMAAPPAGPQQAEINPQFMNAAAALGDQGVFDSAAAAEVLQSPEMADIVSGYLPGLQKAMDQLGRILTALTVQQPELVEEMGSEQYSSLVRKVKQVFKGMGDIVLKLDRQVHMVTSNDLVA